MMRFRIRLSGGLFLIAVLLWSPTWSQQELDPDDGAYQEELLRKKRRFDRLSTQEQDRLRAFSRDLDADPEKEDLVRVMKAYHEWLQSLRPGKRAELLSLPADERIDRIREVLEEEQKERFQRYVRSTLTSDDARNVSAWFQGVIERRETELKARLDNKGRDEIKRSSSYRRMRLTMEWLQLPPGELGLTVKEIEDLKSQLSSGAVSAIEEQSDSIMRIQLIREFINAAWVNRIRGGRMPRIAESDLWEFFSTRLDPEQRSRLEGLTSERMRRELQFLYLRYGSGRSRRGSGGSGGGSDTRGGP
ncbi:MAG TPA: hypothetical protein EYQ75_14905 [Planctomycetaceae bacterium]|nr:hypothetical protein [Planctomycetaceae bacterium]